MRKTADSSDYFLEAISAQCLRASERASGTAAKEWNCLCAHIYSLIIHCILAAWQQTPFRWMLRSQPAIWCEFGQAVTLACGRGDLGRRPLTPCSHTPRGIPLYPVRRDPERGPHWWRHSIRVRCVWRPYCLIWLEFSWRVDSLIHETSWSVIPHIIAHRCW